MALIVACALAGAGAVASCTIDIPDVVEAGTDAVASDGPSSDAGVMLVPVCEAGACGAPAGFAPVLFALDRNTACPSGTLAYDQAADPAADASACACDCTVVNDPTCVPSALTHRYDVTPDAATCNQTGNFTLVVDGGCNAVPGIASLAAHLRLDPFPPVDAGTCASSAKPVASALASSPSRVCVDPACGTCAAPPGFKVCYAAAGTVACPTGMTAHATGASATLACSQCSACSLSATCGGSIRFFATSTCQVPVASPIPVDGKCHATGTIFNAQFTDAVYEGGLAAETCTAGTSQPTPELVEPVTVCCP